MPEALTPGVHVVVPGDVEFCWSPYRHYPHTHHYVRYDDAGNEVPGQVDCDGRGEWARQVMLGHFTDHGNLPCPTCEGHGNLGGDRGDGQPFPCSLDTPRLPTRTPVCGGTGQWTGQVAP